MGRSFFLITILLLLPDNVANSQAERSQRLLFNQIYLAAEKEYGIHQELVNGVLFEEENQDAIGHPYFSGYNLHEGSVLYRGKKYSNLLLQYDIYDQKLLLTYVFDTVEYKLYFNNEFLHEFTIENTMFLNRKFLNATFDNEGDAVFFQAIGENASIKILYQWEKYLNKYNGKMPGKKNIFSSEEKKTFLLLNNKLVGFKGNRSFANKFPPGRKSAIKGYFRKNKLKVKEATDQEMELLIRYIHTLDLDGSMKP